MRGRVVLVSLATLTVVACGDVQPVGAPPESLPSPPTSAAAGTPRSSTTIASARPLAAAHGSLYGAGAAPVADEVGLALPDFEAAIAAAGYGPVRIVWRDGDHLDLTADLVPGRVNVAIETRNGEQVVIDAFVETDPATGGSNPEARIVGVFDDVAFYPACGNEPLDHDGVRWHQVQESDYPDVYERAVRGSREQPPESIAVRGFAPRVVEPGPGDDVGTLVVWSDGVAFFESDSGDLTAWLVDEPLTYEWVC